MKRYLFIFTVLFISCEEEITFDFLKQMINKDETPEKDINVGYQMAKAVRKDLPKKPIKYFWTASGKPGGIHKNNPSDIILQIGKTDYIGYSNKATVGKDVTPKFNTAIHSFYKKLEDKTQYKNVVSLMDKAWNDTAKTVKGKNAKKALSKFKIEKEKPSESISKTAFAALAKEFSDTQAKEKTFVSGITEKYGDGQLDPQTGEYIKKS